jgi:hypothetical protein
MHPARIPGSPYMNDDVVYHNLVLPNLPVAEYDAAPQGGG